jgi:formylglycine-generating enzyme required for sulfatase activity
VTVTRGDGATLEPQKDETIEIQVGDHITVGNSGRAMLRYETRLSVELFRGAQVTLAEIRQEPDERVFMRLFQDGGHIAVNLSQEARMLLRLENSISTLTPLGGSTELLVCQNPAVLTCIGALEGQVEVSAQGEVVTLDPGEATYVLKGAAPEPAVCARPEEIKALEDKMRGTEKFDPLSDLVKSWPVENCTQATRQALAPTRAPRPSGEGMVKIDAGEYQVGKAEADDFHVAEQPISLEAYWIDAYEVTNAQYQEFLSQSGQAALAIKPGQEQHPVRGVTWDQAVAYCAYVNKRLPSEAEWEVAGRGPGPNPPLFPWGTDPEDGGKVDELPRVDTYPVGAFDFNKSHFGVYDLAGNVWEWVGEPYASVAEGLQVLRGGRFGYILDMAYRQPVQPKDERFVPYAGFRCAAGQVGGS